MGQLRAYGPMVAPVAAVLAWTIGCGGGPTAPSDDRQVLSFPVVSTTCAPIGSGPSATYSTVYFVSGLSTKIPDGTARPLEAVLRVGEEARLHLEWDGCGYTLDEEWVSSNPAVASLGEPSFSGLGNRLIALGPGETEIWVEFRAPDGKGYRTYPAYCPASQYVCGEPRTPFTRVRVIAP